jgi:cytochrome c-type biogenesis protein CcmH
VIWLALALVAALILAPVFYALLRPSPARGRGNADRDLFEAQLAELETQRLEGRLDPAAFKAATVEVQRRLLAAPAPETFRAPTRPSLLLLAALVLMPMGGVGVYIWRGFPETPSATFQVREAMGAQEDDLLNRLRERLATADASTEIGRQGFILLGNAERNRGRWTEAAAAWERALGARFDVELAGDLAEVEIERGETASARRWIERGLAVQPGDPRLRFLTGLSEARAGRHEIARNTWQTLLNEAPADAPWREIVAQRLRALP